MAAKNWFIAMVSTTVETDNPESEIKVGLDLLGPITQKWVYLCKLEKWYEFLIKILFKNLILISFLRFVWVSDVYKPKDYGEESQVSDIFCLILLT